MTLDVYRGRKTTMQKQQQRHCRLEDFFFFLMLKKSSDLQHMDIPRTGSYMGSADT